MRPNDDHDVVALRLTQSSAGLRMSADQFFACNDWQEPYFFELINGVVVAIHTLPPADAACIDWLGYRLLCNCDDHPSHSGFETLYGAYVQTRTSVRRVDRAIWVGLRRVAERRDVPAIIIDSIRPGRAAFPWDVADKAAEFIEAGCREYWVLNRFERNLTVYFADGRQKLICETGAISTPLLPGFEISLQQLLAQSDRYDPPQQRELFSS